MGKEHSRQREQYCSYDDYPSDLKTQLRKATSSLIKLYSDYIHLIQINIRSRNNNIQIPPIYCLWSYKQLSQEHNH